MSLQQSMERAEIAAELGRLVDAEIAKARERLATPFWSSNGHNVGADQLEAAKFARAAGGDFCAYDDPKEYAVSVLQRLRELKQSYDRAYPDPDGYGAGAFHTIIDGLSSYIASRGIRAWGSAVPEQWRGAFDAAAEALGINSYAFEGEIETSLSTARFCLKNGEYLLAFDFVQIHLLQLALRLHFTLPTISDVETLLFSRRLKHAQSILLAAFVASRLPRSVLGIAHRYIAGVQSLLEVVQHARVREPITAGIESAEPSSLPIVLFGLDRGRAARYASRRGSRLINEYDADMLHMAGFSLIHALGSLANDDVAAFLSWIFTDSSRALGAVDGTWTVLNYIVADTFSDDWLSDESAACLYCIVVRAGEDRPDFTIAPLGQCEGIAPFVASLAEGARHAAVFGESHIGAENISDLATLSYALFQQIEHMVADSGKLLIICDGLLSLVPYSALRRRSRSCLVEDYEVIVAGSFRALSKNWQIRNRHVKEGAVIGDPDFDLGASPSKRGTPLMRLPESQRECAEVADVTRWQCCVDGNATADAFLRLASAVEGLHLATHGLYDGDVREINIAAVLKAPDVLLPDLERLILSGATIAFAGANADSSRERAFVNGASLARMSLPQLKLVFLSLCLGGIGPSATGVSPFALARGFLVAGTTVVIASLFPVEDCVARQFATAFYRSLGSGSTASAALRDAQRESIAFGAPWYAWAGFQLLV